MKNKEIEELLKGMRDVSNTEGCSMNLDRYLVKLLLSYIEQLEKKVDQYENPDDLTLFYMWLDTKAKDKIKQLEKENKILRENAEHNDKVVDKVNWENQQLKKQKVDIFEYIKNNWYSKNTRDINEFVIGDWRIDILRMLGEIDE